MSPFTPFSPEWLAENRGAPLLQVAIAFTVLQAVFVCLFLVARHLKKTLWNPDVCFILLGFTWNMISIIATLCMIELGLGRHVAVIIQENYPNLVTGQKFLLTQQFAYLFASAFPKLAILYLYHQLFITQTYRRITYAITSVIIVGLIALCIATFLICRPLAYNWDKLIPGGRCGDLGLLFKLVSVPNLITDVAILILPVPMIWKLQMRTSQKVGLTITFLTGSFGIVTAILRLYYFSVGNLFADLTYNGITTTCWTIVEPSCYLIAAIFPSLRPILKIFLESSVYTSFKSRSKSYRSWRGSHSISMVSNFANPSKCTASDGEADTMVKHCKDASIEITQECFIQHVSMKEPTVPLEYLNHSWRNR